jgi:hypothetical protein
MPMDRKATGGPGAGRTGVRGRLYTAANTERLLEKGAREYVNHPRGARFERGRLVLSSICDGLQGDFGGDARRVLLHLRRYADGQEGLGAALRRYEGRISNQYDWGLNEP